MLRALLLALIYATGSVWAHDPITTKLTWSKEISRVFERRCMTCHQNGGKAPFALTSWEEARPWAVAIREEVTRRTMPPWNAVRGFGEFRADPSLTQEEVQLIADWVNGGAPPGDAKYLSGTLPNSWREPDTKGLLRSPTGRLAGVRLPILRKGTALQAVLVRPSGETVPLIWVRSYNPSAGRAFLFREPLDAPRGTRIVTKPAWLAAQVEALWSPRAESRAAARDPGSTGE